MAPDEDSRVQSSLPDKALTAQRIVMEVRSLAGRCEESATAAAEGMDDCEELPDCWQLIYRAALALAKAAAVDELLGNTVTSMRAYHKVLWDALLHLMLVIVPDYKSSGVHGECRNIGTRCNLGPYVTNNPHPITWLATSL